MIEKMTPANAKIDGITLLSIEEYDAAENYIPLLDEWWWLRSPGYCDHSAATVDSDGFVLAFGVSVNFIFGPVRPALKISYSKSSNLEIGNKIRFAKHMWTVIPGDMALCDESIGDHCFDAKSNDFDKSEIKQYLENWLAKKLEEEESL